MRLGAWHRVSTEDARTHPSRSEPHALINLVEPREPGVCPSLGIRHDKPSGTVNKSWNHLSMSTPLKYNTPRPKKQATFAPIKFLLRLIMSEPRLGPSPPQSPNEARLGPREDCLVPIGDRASRHIRDVRSTCSAVRSLYMYFNSLYIL